tara:strand:+ start:452 stop:667 length:216 start_codon:yes stop_codon:yes gene_type:complete
MKNFIPILIFIFTFSGNVNSSEKNKCSDLRDKPNEYAKCIAQKSKELGKKGLKKLNTDSKLTDWIKGKIGK